MTTKLIASIIAGVGTLGGASVGCYYCFKSKAPGSSQSISNKNNNTESSATPKSGTGETGTPIDTKGVVNSTQRNEGSVSSGTQTTQPESIERGTSSSLSSSSDGGIGSPQVGAGGVGT